MRITSLASLGHIIAKVGPLDTLATSRASPIAFEFSG